MVDVDKVTYSGHAQENSVLEDEHMTNETHTLRKTITDHIFSNAHSNMMTGILKQ